MKRRQDKMSDSPTCKQQKTAKEEEAPNSLLFLLMETLQYCIAFVGKGNYQFVGSICKQINKIYANEDEDMKVTFWSNVAVSRNLVANIGEVAAKLGNVKVFKWALWNEYFHDNYWNADTFIDVAENGHKKILELADSRASLYRVFFLLCCLLPVLHLGHHSASTFQVFPPPFMLYVHCTMATSSTMGFKSSRQPIGIHSLPINT
jgi:hypothetical protein